MTQKLTVLQALRDAGERGVTNGDLNRLGIFRYSARVHELREEGCAIRTVKGRNGLARFILEHDPFKSSAQAAAGPTTPPDGAGAEALFDVKPEQPGPRSHWQDAA